MSGDKTPPPENEPSPRVSVIVPVYNGAPFISEAIASIRAQQYALPEIIIVDDGSTDGTAAVVAALGDDLQYIYQPNRGPAAARNRGLEEATGDLIGFLDADDLWSPQTLELALAAFHRDPSTGIVMGHTRTFAPDLATAGSGGKRETPFLAYLVGCALFRRIVLESVGGFDETLRFVEDLDWFMRAREAGISIRVLPEVTLLYRLHAENMTRFAPEPLEKHMLSALRRSIYRRRQDGNGVVDTLAPLQIKEDA